MRVLIFEDEVPAAERLQKLLTQIDSDLDVIEICDTVEGAIEKLKSKPEIDLIISDIELADGLCFGIYEEVDPRVPVIFTTAYNQYAIRAFETHAVDYLLKPIKVEELTRAYEKSKAWLPKKPTPIDYSALARSISSQSQAESKRFLVKYGNKMQVVNQSEVAYFYSVQKATFLVVNGGKAFPIDESLTQVENGMDALKFFRINRNLIVSLESISSVEMLGKGRMKVLLHHPPEDDQFTLVSVERSPDFRRWYAGDMA